MQGIGMVLRLMCPVRSMCEHTHACMHLHMP